MKFVEVGGGIDLSSRIVKHLDSEQWGYQMARMGQKPHLRQIKTSPGGPTKSITAGTKPKPSKPATKKKWPTVA